MGSRRGTGWPGTGSVTEYQFAEYRLISVFSTGTRYLVLDNPYCPIGVRLNRLGPDANASA
jgi:hypothetical protein